MGILLINLFVVYIVSIFARLNFRNSSFFNKNDKYNSICIYIAIISLTIVSGFRYYVGTDYKTYAGLYSGSVDINLLDTIDIGFFALCKILNVFSDNPQIMFLVTSLIINILMVASIRKYSISFELSMYLYITTFMYYSSFNILRQWVAVSITFYSFRYLYKRNFKKYLIFVLTSCLFHLSSLIMIPVYFIVNSKVLSKRNLIIIILFMVSIFAYGEFLDLLFKVLKGTQYEHYFEVMTDTSIGVNPLRVIVYILPVMISILFYRKINNERKIETDIILNLCIIGSLIMFFSIKNLFFARLVSYFEVYYLILIPKIANIGGLKEKRLIYYTILVCYFIYSYVLLRVGDGGIMPYTLKITLF